MVSVKEMKHAEASPPKPARDTGDTALGTVALLVFLLVFLFMVLCLFFFNVIFIFVIFVLCFKPLSDLTLTETKVCCLINVCCVASETKSVTVFSH